MINSSVRLEPVRGAAAGERPRAEPGPPQGGGRQGRRGQVGNNIRTLSSLPFRLSYILPIPSIFSFYFLHISFLFPSFFLSYFHPIFSIPYQRNY